MELWQWLVSYFTSEPVSHFTLISFIYFLTWFNVVTLKGWVSDDIQGIAQFSDHFIQEKDAQGNITKEYKVDTYETDRKDKEGKPIRIKMTAWPGYLGWPSCFMRWFRLNLGRTFKEIGKNKDGHKIYGYVQDARKHHALSLIVQWFNIILLYLFLSRLFNPEVALIASIIFAVHPCTVQATAWISGVNYSLSLLFALASFNLVLYTQNPYITLPLIAIFTIFSCVTLLQGCFNFIILIMLGAYNESAIAFLAGAYILFTLGKWSFNFRVEAFKKQAMEKSTNLYFRKLIIMVKTFWYYVKLVLFPKRLGLFHTWGYHFEDPLEHVNGEFWLGILSLAIYGLAIYLSPLIVQFGLIWAFAYFLLFSNFITANQVVSERYMFFSLVGISLVIAHLLQGYPILVAFLVGIYVMRVWVHMPTFANEVRFYESNIFNFPESEVAMGNLGVAYLNHGLRFKSMDTWLEASRQNALYDVPWYNLYQMCKQSGDLQGAHKFLTLCLRSEKVHFKKEWVKEMEEFNKYLSMQGSISDFSKKLNQLIKEGNYERARAF